MTENEIRSQIAAKEEQITKIEEEASKKEAGAENEVNANYGAKIAEIETKLSAEEASLAEATAKADEWVNKRKELAFSVKSLKAEYKLLNKEKDSGLRVKVKEINGDKKAQISPIRSAIKAHQKELKALEKAALR